MRMRNLVAAALVACVGAAGCNKAPIDPDTVHPLVLSVVQDRGVGPGGEVVVVTFDSAMTNANVAANYSIGGLVVTSADVQSGGEVVVLTANGPVVPGIHTLTISANVVDDTDDTLENRTGLAVTSTDSVAPQIAQVAGVTVGGLRNDTIDVTFDDDMVATDVLDVSAWVVEAPVGTPFSVLGTTPSYDASTRTARVTLDLSSTQNLVNGDSIRVSILGARDVAGNVVAPTPVAGSVGGDFSPPAVLAAAADGVSAVVEVRFDENATFLDTADLILNQPISGTRFTLTTTPLPSVGSVALVGNPLDADAVTISDGTTPVTFEFDIGDGVDVSSVQVLIGADRDATAVNLAAAINADAFGVTASPGALAHIVDLVNDADANNDAPIGKVDAGGNITTSGMSGGLDAEQGALSTVVLDEGLGVRVTYPVVPAVGDTIEVYGVADVAGNSIVPVSRTIVLDDMVQPSLVGGACVLTAVEGEDNDAVLVKFDRPMCPIGLDDPSSYSLTLGMTAIDLQRATYAFDGVDEVTITLDGTDASDLTMGGAYDLSVVDVQSAQGVVRTMADTEMGVTPVGDTVPPDVPAGEARLDPLNADSILVTWDEAVGSSAAQASAYTNAGNAATAATLLAPRVVRVTFDVAPMVGDLVVIAAASAQDRAGNAALTDVSLALAAADATGPSASVSGTAVANDGGDLVTIDFDEPVNLAAALDVSSYTVTNGGAVSLVGAALRYTSATDEVTIRLADGVALDRMQNVGVAIAGVTDVAGNALAAQPAAGMVGGDTTPPAIAAAFVNYREDVGGAVIEVRFSEDVDAAAAVTAGGWSGSGGQTATGVEAVGLRAYRVTFDAPIGVSDTVTRAAIADLAGNASGALLVDPAE